METSKRLAAFKDQKSRKRRKEIKYASPADLADMRLLNVSAITNNPYEPEQWRVLFILALDVSTLLF